MIDLTRARYVAAFVIIGTTLFVALALVYWGGWHAWSLCVYGKADCSLTVATYVLCIITAAAFVAAYAAAGWAYRTYELERAVVLAQRVCRGNHEDSIRYFYCDRDLRFVERDLLRENDGDYIALDFELESLGRSAVIDGKLYMVCDLLPGPGRGQDPLVVPIDDINLKYDGAIHLRVYLAPDVVNFGATIYLRVADRQSRVRRRKLELIALPPQRPKYRAVVQLEETAVAGLESDFDPIVEADATA